MKNKRIEAALGTSVQEANREVLQDKKIEKLWIENRDNLIAQRDELVDRVDSLTKRVDIDFKHWNDIISSTHRDIDTLVEYDKLTNKAFVEVDDRITKLEERPVGMWLKITDGKYHKLELDRNGVLQIDSDIVKEPDVYFDDVGAMKPGYTPTMEEIDPESSPWKPEANEEYWYVGDDGFFNAESFIWLGNGDSTDCKLYELGNCFETKKQAEAAAERVRKALHPTKEDK